MVRSCKVWGALIWVKYTIPWLCLHVITFVKALSPMKISFYVLGLSISNTVLGKCSLSLTEVFIFLLKGDHLDVLPFHCPSSLLPSLPPRQQKLLFYSDCEIVSLPNFACLVTKKNESLWIVLEYPVNFQPNTFLIDYHSQNTVFIELDQVIPVNLV